jgi:hypothetical protein
MILTLGWEIYARSAGGEYLFAMPTVYPAFAGSVLALVVVSLATPAPSEQDLAAVR